MDISALFIANAQPTELIEPCKSPFDHPPIFAQTATVLGVSFSEQRHHMSATKPLTDSLRVIAPIPDHGIRTMPWASSPSPQGWDGINEHGCLLRIVAVGASELDDQRHALSVAD